ncbi:MAG: hypothetical protein JWR47_1564 [Phenylobacterium sp.]|nr:hypothetical protein [Phenylobacterium sp.]MDB5435307.1 hypothetical protein [Phenylobacterium sp.]MDB5500079.1 hypothetical protein [Phenylobacterium sp.]
MRTSMIALIVAACAVTGACTKKSSLFLEPGRAAEAPKPTKSAAKIPPRPQGSGDAPARP